MGRIRLALIAGGTSGEREVSLRGAAGVEQALNQEKYEVVRYDPATDLARLAADAGQIDAAFILLHGIGGEDGTVQGMLDLLGIPYQGSGVLGSALAMDKHMAKTMYKLHDLPVAAWEMAEKAHVADPLLLLAKLRLPLVVKPVRQGSSLGMSIVKQHPEQLSAALATAFAHDSRVMAEEFIKGREITVGVLGNDKLTALPLVEIIPDSRYDFFDYKAKYTPGATREVCPAEISDSIRERAQDYGIRAHNALQLRGYSRTDMIIRDDGEIFLLETNTIPGMTPTSLLPQAAAQAGLDFSALLDRLIELAME
ncbi:D-alanine--D-alanine ligase [Desulfobulbus sp. F4]|nr:D-alanine--D-alanine ligase [Desulfobulbus sp. F3]MCW5201058.1 D-alanine--D-alanine ligase [Desulfobulbus sp. F4]